MNGMLDLVQKLVKGNSMSESYVEVVDLLTTLRDSRSEVAVRFEGDSNYYPSFVTAVSPRHRVMTIRDSVPAAPSALMKDKEVIVKAAKQGRELTLESRFIEPLAEDFSLGYQLTIPDRLGTTRPRKAFRVLLDDIRNRVRITLEGPDHQQINGTVRDISRLGVGMKTDSELPRFLSKYFHGDNQVVGCNIELEDHRRINCKMEIRNVHAVSSDTHATLIGGRIMDLDQQDSSLLADFVAQLTREHMRAYA